MSDCGCPVRVIAGATGPRGASSAGVTTLQSGEYTIAGDVGCVLFDLTSVDGVIVLPSLLADNLVVVKDQLGLASASRTISALGTVDNIVNPVLVNLTRGWAWLKFTKYDNDANPINIWSLVG